MTKRQNRAAGVLFGENPRNKYDVYGKHDVNAI
jgi:hypothetical protein